MTVVIGAQVSSTSIAKRRLDSTPRGYLSVINELTSNGLAEHTGKLSPILPFVRNPKLAVSVGIGSGLELHALRMLFPSTSTELAGIEVSDNAIAASDAYLASNGIDCTIIRGNATDMRSLLKSRQPDVIVLSAVMHEVYSYSEDGREAWCRVISDAAACLADGGVMLVRDFAPPRSNQTVSLKFISEEAAEFYEYFSEHYRTVGGMRDSIGNPYNPYKALLRDGDVLYMPLDKAAEIILHFNNYLIHVSRGIVSRCDPTWKEVNEAYLVPDPLSQSEDAMTADAYPERVLGVANDAIRSYSVLECVSSEISERSSRAELMGWHFELSSMAGEESESLMRHITSKAAYVFRKRRTMQK